MKFKLNNLGPLKDATIELGDLTIICGKNNTGKTYISYSVYGFLKMWKTLCSFGIEKSTIDSLLQNGVIKIELEKYESQIQQTLSNLSQAYKNELNFVFSTDNDVFKDSSFEVMIEEFAIDYQKELNKSYFSSKNKKVITAYKGIDSKILEVTALTEEKLTLPDFAIHDFLNNTLGNIFFGDYFKNAFIITSERTGISLFYKELDIHKNVMVEQISNKTRDKKSDDFSSFFDMYNKVLSRYAKPIKDNIDYVRDFDTIAKKKSFLLENKDGVSKFIENMIGGSFKINDDQLFFIDKKTKQAIPIHITSSAVKSLIGLNYYLKHLATPNDLLIIDEPELTLHPDNQRKMARLIARLVNLGIKVFITTHSDYLLKELNTLIMLSNEFEAKTSLMKKYKYEEEDVLSLKKVRAYATSDGVLKEVPIDRYGMEVETFDDEINEMNKISDEVYLNVSSGKDDDIC